MLLQHKLKPKVPQHAEKLKPLFQFSKKTYSSHHKPHCKYQNRRQIENRRLGLIVTSFQDILYRFYQANKKVSLIYTPVS